MATRSAQATSNSGIVLAAPWNRGNEDSVVGPFAQRLRFAGLCVHTIELAAGKEDAHWVKQLQIAVAQIDTTNQVVIGGFSLGARIATALAHSYPVKGVLALGFPAHKKGEPTSQHGLDSLRKLAVPSLVLQGSRDCHGSESEFRGYDPLPSSIQFHWLADANHRWHTRHGSEHDQSSHLDSAARAALQWMASLVSKP